MVSPVAAAKESRISLSLAAASVEARAMMSVSSAYCKTAAGSWWAMGWDRSEVGSACVISCFKMSDTVMKRYGERGSPCLSLFLQLIQGPGMPFRRTAVLPVVRMCRIQSQK